MAVKECLATVEKAEVSKTQFIGCNRDGKNRMCQDLDDALDSFRLLVHKYDPNNPLRPRIDKVGSGHDIMFGTLAGRDSFREVKYLMNKYLWYLEV